jgi:protein gp37
MLCHPIQTVLIILDPIIPYLTMGGKDKRKAGKMLKGKVYDEMHVISVLNEDYSIFP